MLSMKQQMPVDILLITRNFYPKIGGVESYITEFIKIFIKKQKGNLCILCPKKCSLPVDLENTRIHLYTPRHNYTFAEIDILLKGFLVWFQGFIFQIIIFTKGMKFLIKKKRDIFGIYGVGGPFAIIPAITLARLFGKKAFGHMHADFQFARRNGLLKTFYRSLFGNLDKVFVNSKDVQIDLTNLGVKKDKVVIINNWVDTGIFNLKDKQQCRQKLGLPLDKKLLLFVGRLSFEKGINEVLETVDLLEKDERCVFIIVGEGSLAGKVEDKLKVCKNICYFGPKKSAELVDFYNACDVLLWGSIDTYYVSITVMEALHCGMPVLAPLGTTNVRKWGKREFSVKNYVIPGHIGRLFPSTSEDLAKAIKLFPWEEFNRESIKQYAKQHYSNNNAAPILEEFYA